MSRIALALAITTLSTAGLFAQDVVLPDGKAKALVQNACAECHGLDQVVNNAMPREDWRATVNRMVKRGATLSPPEIDAVVDYLSVYFAPDKVNVNTATTKELQSGLGLTDAEAKAVIEYRNKNGKIADLDAFVKASGADAKKLDAKKGLIVF